MEKSNFWVRMIDRIKSWFHRKYLDEKIEIAKVHKLMLLADKNNNGCLSLKEMLDLIKGLGK